VKADYTKRRDEKFTQNSPADPDASPNGSAEATAAFSTDQEPSINAIQDPAHIKAADDEGADTTDVSANDTLDEKVTQLELEKSDLTNRLLRTAAEIENLRKRVERDLANAHRYAITKFAGDLLVVGDSLRRALESVPTDSSVEDAPLKGLVDGLHMTERELERVLDKHGIKKIAASGERFDPHLHQAIFDILNPDVVAGTIVEEVQPGYLIGTRILRAAMVGVAKGGPRPPSTADAAPTDDVRDDILNGDLDDSSQTNNVGSESSDNNTPKTP